MVEVMKNLSPKQSQQAWFLQPRPGWIQYAGYEVDINNLDEEDIANIIIQINLEHFGEEMYLRFLKASTP